MFFYTKILSSTIVYNVDNDKNKYFLSSKSAYYNDYWRMWHWRQE